MKTRILTQRITALREGMKKNDIDTIIVLSDENRMYLSGYTGVDGRYDETAGILVITHNDLILACDPRYDTQAEREASLFTVVRYDKTFTKELPKILKSVNASKVGFESERLTLKNYKAINKEIIEAKLDIKINSDNNLLKNLRVRKNEYEISMIKKALKISEDSFIQLKNLVKEGMSEIEAAWVFEKLLRENGAESLSFDIIMASGENSALPHAIPSNRKIKKNEPLICDFGVRIGGYCSDTTRTLIIGKATDEFKKIYEIIFQAQNIAVDNIKPGIKANFIDKLSRDYINNTEYKGKFGHGLGHGVGIVIHEAPSFSKFDDTVLEPGMILTVEPGIYIPGWGGIRIENMVEVTDYGVNVLNNLSHDDYLI